MSKINNYERNSRIINLDFLRGFFIILALYQHFSYYVNVWYIDYFRDAIALTTTYSVHFPMIGKKVLIGNIEYWFALIFTPWVSQIYLTMSAFNLAKRTQTEFAENLFYKLKIFSMIFIFFILENFIVAPNFGQAISFYPIMLWMVVLSLLAIIYRYAGINGIIVLSGISLLRFIIPIDYLSDFFEELIRTTIHPGYEYDARLEYFILSGCLGFVMGYIHYHVKKFKKIKNQYFMMIGTALVLAYVKFGDPFSIVRDDVFMTEHDLASTFTGSLYILGIQAIVISAFLWLEDKNIQYKVPVINWIGINSILIFALHRILFVRLIAPVSVMVGSIVGRTLSPTFLELYTYIIITLILCYLIKVSKISDLILKNNS